MNKKLDQAINTVEQAGGIVIMQDTSEPELAPMSESKITAIEEEEKERLEDYQNRKNDMKENFDNMIGEQNVSFSSIEDMVHSHGLDLDDLEDVIHSFY
jgi:hypothetical protein